MDSLQRNGIRLRLFFRGNSLLTGEPDLKATRIPRTSNSEYLRGLARAFAGSVIFAFPLLMTMEMWWLGFYLDRARLLLFMAAIFVLLVPLSSFVGFERTGGLWQDVLDAFVAFAVGAIASASLLALFGIITPAMPAAEVVGKIAVQTVPASFGAILARGQLGSGKDETRTKRRETGYLGELLTMTAGAVFLAFNVAPTEEMVLISLKMTPWHAVALVLLSIALLHAFVYALGFRGQEKMPDSVGRLGGIASYSIAGYGIAALVSLYVLWTFGRTDGVAVGQVAMMTSVLAFPAALGAASARLII